MAPKVGALLNPVEILILVAVSHLPEHKPLSTFYLFSEVITECVYKDQGLTPLYHVCTWAFKPPPKPLLPTHRAHSHSV